MSRDEKHIELRVSHRGGPYVAVLGGRHPEFGFERLFNPFRCYVVRHEDGSKEEIHHLPDANLVYEIDEYRDGKRVRWYAASIEGNQTLHRISRYGAEMVSKKRISVRRAIREYPERPELDSVEDED